MKDIRCIVGGHSRQHHVGHEMGGRGAGYDLCERCHKERASYEKGSPSFRGLL